MLEKITNYEEHGLVCGSCGVDFILGAEEYNNLNKNISFDIKCKRCGCEFTSEFHKGYQVSYKFSEAVYKIENERQLSDYDGYGLIDES